MIDRATAAHYVLYVTGQPGSWIPPGGFYRRLIDAALHADGENLYRLSLGFPNVGWAVEMFKNNPDGLTLLKETAEE